MKKQKDRSRAAGVVDTEDWVNINEVNGTRFIGNAKEASGYYNNAEIDCELFSNNKKYFLYGKWTEEENIYTRLKYFFYQRKKIHCCNYHFLLLIKTHGSTKDRRSNLVPF